MASRTKDDWPHYLAEYHRQNAGITEDAFARFIGIGPGARTPHHWLAEVASPAGRMLDIGCGSAPLHEAMNARGTYVGLDLSPFELAEAQLRGRNGLARGDALAIPLVDEAFDTVASSMALMLVRPLEQALAEIRRVLRPGGRFVALAPSPWPLVAADVIPLLRIGVPLHGPGAMPQHISARRWRRLLSRCGFETIELRRRMFRLPMGDRDDAELAVRALYTPGRSEVQRQRAIDALSGWARPSRSVPVPLLRISAQRATVPAKQSAQLASR